MSAKEISASGVEAPPEITQRKTSPPHSNNAADIPGELDHNQLIASGTNSREERRLPSSRTNSIALAKLYTWLTSTADTLVKVYTESSKEEKVYLHSMALGTLPFVWHLIWTLLEACISSVDWTARLLTTVLAVLGSPILLWITLDTSFPVRIRLTSFIANRCNGLIVTLELLRGYSFALHWLWEMVTSGPELILMGVMAVTCFIMFAMLGFLFVAFVLGSGFDGGDCDLFSILGGEEKKKKKEGEEEEEEEKKE